MISANCGCWERASLAAMGVKLPWFPCDGKISGISLFGRIKTTEGFELFFCEFRVLFSKLCLLPWLASTTWEKFPCGFGGKVFLWPSVFPGAERVEGVHGARLCRSNNREQTTPQIQMVSIREIKIMNEKDRCSQSSWHRP